VMAVIGPVLIKNSDNVSSFLIGFIKIPFMIVKKLNRLLTETGGFNKKERQADHFQVHSRSAAVGNR